MILLGRPGGRHFKKPGGRNRYVPAARFFYAHLPAYLAATMALFRTIIFRYTSMLFA